MWEPRPMITKCIGVLSGWIYVLNSCQLEHPTAIDTDWLFDINFSILCLTSVIYTRKFAFDLTHYFIAHCWMHISRSVMEIVWKQTSCTFSTNKQLFKYSKNKNKQESQNCCQRCRFYHYSGSLPHNGFNHANCNKTCFLRHNWSTKRKELLSCHVLEYITKTKVLDSSYMFIHEVAGIRRYPWWSWLIGYLWSYKFKVQKYTLHFHGTTNTKLILHTCKVIFIFLTRPTTRRG